MPINCNTEDSDCSPNRLSDFPKRLRLWVKYQFACWLTSYVIRHYLQSDNPYPPGGEPVSMVIIDGSGVVREVPYKPGPLE